MNSWHLALQSFKHYLPVNLAIALGVAASTAVLTGALLVGESMRKSLRDLTLDRLGDVDELVVSRGFFNEDSLQLESDAGNSKVWERSVPAILFNNGTVETESNVDQSVQRAANVNVFGIPNAFWELDRSDANVKELSGEVAIINEALAEQLGIDPGSVSEKVTLRIPKPTQLPAESALGATRDLIESLVGIEVVQVLPNKGLAGFSLHQSQLDSPNIFVPIELLQDSLSRKALKHKPSSEQANVKFLQRSAAGRNVEADFGEVIDGVRTLADEGLTLKRVTSPVVGNDSPTPVFDYWSLSSEQLVLRGPVVEAIVEAVPNAKPVFTYLANDIRKQNGDAGVPFSMVAAIDFDESFELLDTEGSAIKPLGENEIVLNEWAAENLKVGHDDQVTITWYAPETTHGKQIEQSANFRVAAVTPLTQPSEPFELRRRGQLVPATFEQSPTLGNDTNLTPEVPGVTDAESIENWDLPFDTASKLRPEDDAYWDYHRTTPKAFVSLAAGQKLWGSRFGEVTSFRIPVGDGDDAIMAERILTSITKTDGASSFDLVSIRENAVAASSGSTPFDALFLALSMFVIASGLILVSLLFRLALQSRAAEVGVLQAVGVPSRKVSGVWIREMTLVCSLGAFIGILIGIGYAAAMIWGLKTWWLGAISKPIIKLHVGPTSILAGLIGGILICVGTIQWVLRSLRRQNTRTMLAGLVEEKTKHASGQGNRWTSTVIVVLLILAVLLSVVALGLSGDAQAGSFMGSGFCVLTALLMMVLGWLKTENNDETATSGLQQLSLTSLKRNPLRSTLTIGLVAVASFLITAVSSFHLTPTEQGTAGFDYVAQSSQPIFADLGSKEGQLELLDEALSGTTRIFGFRFKPGEDASCNNLYQSTQPRVLGVPADFVTSFDSELPSFAWGGSVAETEAESTNPWHLLDRTYDDGAVPVIIDKNTANYSLKIFAPGGDYTVQFDTGEEVTFRVVGFLSNTILQGSLLVSEKDFVRVFPYLGGARYFLIDADESTGEKAVTLMESQLGDEGFDAQSANALLANFMSVQNTYLSTFQALGALGLLLGTFGLAAVQIRNVLERKRELGLMRAVGFGKGRLSMMILIENCWLLGVGLAVGVLAAVCGTLPHYLFGDASVPWLALGAIFVAIFVIGVIASFFATRVLSGMNLLDSLRA